MIINPKFRGFICTTAHPTGCEMNVKQQIEYVVDNGQLNGPKNVLVIGASTGFGLASRIVSAFGSGASTIGIFYERCAVKKRTATAGWYNTVAFEKFAKKEGLYAKSINGDAFSNEIKTETIDLIKKDLGKIDLVIYSLAAPRRTNPNTGVTSNSVLKPIGSVYSNKTIDFHTKEISKVSIDPATEEEIKETINVMGGDDWKLWMEALNEAGVLANAVKTVAYSYIGPQITHAVYTNGTIGMAKLDLEEKAVEITASLKDINGKAYISVNKALVTQSSSAIPVVPLYISILNKIMKEKNIHEGCIEQIYRLFNNRLYNETTQFDEKGRIRVDDWEMRDDVQKEVIALWETVNSENIDDLTDIEGLRNEFFNLFGFNVENVDYEEEVEHDVQISSIE